MFVACFSKSWTNWAMQMVVQIAHRGAAEFGHIHDLVAWPESKFHGIVALDEPAAARGAPTGLRGIKTAFEADYVPYSPAAKYVSVIRDPKDVCISAYYFLTGVFGLRADIELETWLDMALAPDGFLRAWPRHLASYWSMRGRSNVCVLEFAAMKRDLAAAIDALAAVMGVELEPEERAEVIHRAGFEHMQANESQFAPPRLPLLTGRERGQMVRSGKTFAPAPASAFASAPPSAFASSPPSAGSASIGPLSAGGSGSSGSAIGSGSGGPGRGRGPVGTSAKASAGLPARIRKVEAARTRDLARPR